MSLLADDLEHRASPRVLFWILLGLIGLGVMTARAPWASAHGLMFGVAGLLMLIFPPAMRLPRAWWLLAAGAALAMLGAFLPDAWFAPSAWRTALEAHGLATGSRVAVQSAAAWEGTLANWATLAVVMWLLGHRQSSGGVRLAALIFVVGVALLAVLALEFPSVAASPTGEPTYGFFPNRNHNAILMVMAAITGLGLLVQAIREGRLVVVSISATATIFLLCMVLGWSVSRAGVLLLALGVLLWLAILGPGYFGSHARRALLLLAAAATGWFLIAQPAVMERLQATIHHQQAGNLAAIDLRLPTWADTLTMIQDRPWTGVGTGQFTYVFPQFRHHTATAQHFQQYHPESDWLWFAAEAGVPATLLVLGLVASVVIATATRLRDGRARALRASCLVAAVVLVIHGLIDVPGHRVPLAWSAALMLALALRTQATPSAPNPWLARAAGLPVLLLGAWLSFLQLADNRGPACARGDDALTEAFRLYQADRAARRAGEPAPTNPKDDPLQLALQKLDSAIAEMPLDGRLHHFRASLALHFNGTDQLAEKAFAIERALDPTCIETPVKQAQVWGSVDPTRATQLIHLTRRQATAADQRHLPAPQNYPSWIATAEAFIHTLSYTYPKLDGLAPASTAQPMTPNP